MKRQEEFKQYTDRIAALEADLRSTSEQLSRAQAEVLHAQQTEQARADAQALAIQDAVQAAKREFVKEKEMMQNVWQEEQKQLRAESQRLIHGATAANEVRTGLNT